MRRQHRKATGEKFFVFSTISLYAVIYYTSPGKAFKAIGYSVDVFFDVILLVLAGISLGGLIKAALPSDSVVGLLGQEKGVRAYFNSILLANVLPGEAYVRIPLFEAFLDKGAGLGPFASLSTSRPLLVNFPQGVAFLGLPIAIIQVISTVVGALCAGLFAAIVQKKFEIVKQDSKGPRRKKGR